MNIIISATSEFLMLNLLLRGLPPFEGLQQSTKIKPMLLECFLSSCRKYMGNTCFSQYIQYQTKDVSTPKQQYTKETKPFLSKCIGVSWNNTVINSTCTRENGFLSRDKNTKHKTSRFTPSSKDVQVGSAIWQTGKNSCLGINTIQEVEEITCKNTFKKKLIPCFTRRSVAVAFSSSMGVFSTFHGHEHQRVDTC